MKYIFGFQAMDQTCGCRDHFFTRLCLRAVEVKHLLLVRVPLLSACGKVRGQQIK